jgi:hypothetical protein
LLICTDRKISPAAPIDFLRVSSGCRFFNRYFAI